MTAPTLTIAFRSGRIYEYVNVPLSTHEGLMAAGSKGRYFNVFIRFRYRYRRVA